jgi:hypothetical protein
MSTVIAVPLGLEPDTTISWAPRAASEGIRTLVLREPVAVVVAVPSETGVECRVSVTVLFGMKPDAVTVTEEPGVGVEVLTPGVVELYVCATAAVASPGTAIAAAAIKTVASRANKEY